MINNSFEIVKEEAREHFLVNGETYICWNSKRGYFYCNYKDLRVINIRDHNEELHPRVMGDWSNNIMLGCHGKPIKLGYSYKELTNPEEI